MARDHIEATTKFQLLGGYFSPVSDAYNKPGLASSPHRVHMLQLALKQSDWIMVDPWESSQKTFQRTAVVLDHFHEKLNGIRKKYTGEVGDGDVEGREGVPIKVVLLAGGDLIESFQIPGLWDLDDVHCTEHFRW